MGTWPRAFGSCRRCRDGAGAKIRTNENVEMGRKKVIKEPPLQSSFDLPKTFRSSGFDSCLQKG